MCLLFSFKLALQEAHQLEKGVGNAMEQKTPLYDTHVALGGKMVPFASYLLPVQYSGIIEEHLAVRQAAGHFDVSHMGELSLKGKDAVKTLNELLSNDFSTLKDGRVRYSPMLNPEGGIMDDLLVYRLSEEHYWMVVNAANREKDANWVRTHLLGDTSMEDISDRISQIALQGPRSKEILEKLTRPEELPTGYYTFREKVYVAGVSCLLSRTGYTGSFGYELYCSAENVQMLWTKLLEVGKEYGLIPCGLGARDTLRLEAGMPLYGHEMTEDITPFEAGLDFAVKMQKETFIGKDALLKRGEPARVRVGLKVVGRGIIREEAPLFIEGKEIGESTSGTHLPYLKGAYAMALIDKQYKEPGTHVTAEVRGRKIEAEVVPLPFYHE